jgi:HAD superfamily hydrolase (TIGR01509 family)
MSKYKNILFDCDGTLVDSEIIAMRVAAEILIDHVEKEKKDHNLSVDGIIEEFSGWHFDDMIDELENRFNVAINHDEAQQSKMPKTLSALKQVLEIPSMKNTLNILAPQKNIALVTSSEFSRVNLCLDVTGLNKYFPEEVKFSAHDSLPSPKHKPAPDVYQLALSSIHSAPEESLAIEDSVSGVKSARNASIDVIGFVGGSHIKPENKKKLAYNLISNGALCVIEDMRDLPALIHSLDTGNSLSGLNGAIYKNNTATPTTLP